MSNGPKMRSCELCGKAMAQRESESSSEWRKRIARARFCSPKCASVAHRRHPPSAEPHLCDGCGTVLIKRPTEAFATFELRTFCGRICADVAKRKRIDIFGVQLTVREFCAMTGESISGVRSRLYGGRPPWRVTGHIGDGRGGGGRRDKTNTSALIADGRSPLR